MLTKWSVKASENANKAQEVKLWTLLIKYLIYTRFATLLKYGIFPSNKYEIYLPITCLVSVGFFMFF